MGTQLPLPQKGQSPPIFGPSLLWPNSCMDQDGLGAEVDLGPANIVLDGDPTPPPQKREHSPLIFGPCLLWPNGWMHQDATWCDGRPWPMPHCVRQGSSPSERGTAAPSPGPCLLWSQSPISATAELLRRYSINAKLTFELADYRLSKLTFRLAVPTTAVAN